VEQRQNRFENLAFGEFEGIATNTVKVEHLVADEFPAGADLALVSISFAKETGDGETAAVDHRRKLHHDQGEALEIRSEIFQAIVTGQTYAKWTLMLRELLSFP
jgi:hypothetical protein